MQGTALVPVLVWALAAVALCGLTLRAVPDCPPPDPESGAAHLPNPEDCATFWVCAGSGPVLLPCLNGTWFNPEAGVCDWPVNVPEGVCDPPTVPPPTQPTTEEPPATTGNPVPTMPPPQN